MNEQEFRLFSMWALVRAQGCFAPSIVKAMLTGKRGGDFLHAINKNAALVFFGKTEKDAGLLTFVMFILECGECFPEVSHWAETILSTDIPLLLSEDERKKMGGIALRSRLPAKQHCSPRRELHFAGTTVHIP